MLPAYIIEQIRQREKEQAQQEQPVLRLPEFRAPSSLPPEKEEETDRGVVIIDL